MTTTTMKAVHEALGWLGFSLSSSEVEQDVWALLAEDCKGVVADAAAEGNVDAIIDILSATTCKEW